MSPAREPRTSGWAEVKAAVYHAYGLADALELVEVDDPRPSEGEVLIGVRAASVNSWDWDLLRGTPIVNRVGAFRRPKHEILGADVAGVVEAVGGRVRDFAVRDEVYGDVSGCHWGGFAEYVCARPDALARKPACLDFAQAAALPQAGMLALQALRDVGRMQPGQSILINGAGGGVGTLGVQLARALGASHVTGVDRGPKLEAVRALGADEVIDFTEADYAGGGPRFDLIVDPAGFRPIHQVLPALRTRGTYVLVGGAGTVMIQGLALSPWYRWRQHKRVALLRYRPKGDDLRAMAPLLECGELVPHIDRVFPLADMADALSWFSEGNAVGKIVIAM